MAEPSRKTSTTTRKHARRDTKGPRGRIQPVSSEYFKELQMKAKEEKEMKRSRMDTRHEFLLSTVAEWIGLPYAEAEEFMLEGDQLDYFDKFFAENGLTALIFYYKVYQDVQDVSESDSKDSKKLTKQLWITDGTQDPYPGCCLFFVRLNPNKPITNLNIHQEAHFGMLDSNGEGLLGAIERLLGSLFLPALQKYDKWGELSGAEGQKVKQQFLSKLASFVSVLTNAQASINDVVKLTPCTHTGITKLKTSTEMIAAAGNSEIVEAAENCALIWCREIEQILTESEQMRKEADDVGPKAELEYWKKRLARYDSLTTCIKSQQCKTIVSILIVAKSKVLKTWKNFDIQITDFTNECKDNVKFLYTLEKFCEPLYKCNPVTMLDSIPGLMNAIRMINSYSRYYNTSERMTALFVKVTNQMINACRAHLTDSGYHKIWEQDRDVVIHKMQECLNLNREYQQCFQSVKKKLEDHPEERSFDFSEMYIFGKFNNFSRRLEKLTELLETVGVYSALSLSHIEGIEQLNSRFNLAYTSLKKKPYDVLDQRKMDFDSDYDDFKRQLLELNAQLLQLMDDTFKNSASTILAVNTAKRFMRLKIPAVNVKERYSVILSHFHEDLKFVQSQYDDEKQDPPTLHNRPPIANAIGWSRQLYQKISQPVKAFYQLPGFLDMIETKRLIRVYNHLAQVLVEYELIHLRQWRMKMNVARQSLLSTVLVRHHEGRLIANFDSSITEFFREVQVLQGMSIEIPQEASLLYSKKASILENHEMINLVVEEYDRVISKVPELFSVLMQPHKEKLDVSISPGLTSLRWTSINIQGFVDNSHAAIRQFDQFVDNVIGIHEDRILQIFKVMLKTPLINVPQHDVISVSEFVKTATKLCQVASVNLENKSFSIETAVNDLIGLLLPDYSELPENTPDDLNEAGALTLKRKLEQRDKLFQEADLLFEYFEQQNIETLLQLLRSALELLKKRVTIASTLTYTDRTQFVEHFPLFVSDIILSLPNLVISPSLEGIQQAMNQVISVILSITKNIYCWGQVRPISPIHVAESEGLVQVRSKTKVVQQQQQQQGGMQKLKTYFHSVSEHKEMSKLISSMGGAISSTKSLVKNTVDQFNIYDHLWVNDCDEYMIKFSEDSPGVTEYQQEMYHLTQIESDILQQPDSLTAGAVCLNTEQLKLTLVTEAKQWRIAYGRTMSNYYQTLLEKTFESIEEWAKSLSHPLEDLEDIRNVMATLKEVRENEIEIDASLGPIEECYTLLQKYGINVTQEEVERVDTVRYLWHNLNQQVSKIVSELLLVQDNFRSSLMENIEQFNKDNNEFVANYDQKGPMVLGIHPREASDRLIIYQGQFEDLWRKHQTYSGGEELFGLVKTDYPELSRIKKELNLLQKLYSLYNNVMDSVDGYYDILWTEVDIEKINNELLEFQNKCRKLPKGLKEWQAYKDLTKKIDDFNAVCPLLERMADKAMKDRHWKRIEGITKHTFDFDSDSFTLRNIMDAPLLQNIEDIEDVCIAAVKEQDIDSKMKQVSAEWAIHNLAFSGFKARGELLLRGEETNEIISLMEDSLMVLSSLMSNRYNTPFKKNIQKWVKDLTNTSEILENWLVVQNLWVYLEAVFVGGDIAKQLPKEAKRFQSIDKSWIKIMSKAHETTNVVQCCVGDETLGQLLPHLLEQLELCQKSLTGYLEKKRLIFPRFFFVSDPALLEILGQASDSHTIQAHLLSVFDNVKTVTFHEKDYDRITHINSKEPETVELEKPVMAQGNVEIWLGKLLNMAKQSLHGVIRQAVVAIKDPNFELINFLNTYPAQVGLLGLQIIWTADATQALKSARTDKKIMPATDQRFLDILNSLIEVTTQELNKIDRVKFETLITIHLHQRDIFNDLVCINVKSPTDFDWLKQSRFYFNEDTDKCVISITDVNFTYQDEFLGCNERLVITPLTDRCYITLAQALGMSMGGSPAGPAGTGKTETTKDMGKALGKYVVVFNCSDQMDFRGLGRIYKGLAQSGSWGCFDEFNRIELPVLSVAAQQVAVILQCRKERKPEFIFTDGDVVSLNPEFGLFLTMNPGYAGRQELPENLKMNFRPIAMMVPDRQIIIRVKLASCGFLQNVVLACKFYTLYKLCEEQLSKQVHYDFGLRNILSVLRSLGPVKRMCPNDSEEMIVMRGLRDMNLSKLVDEDEPLFRSLIDDLFPGITLETAGYPDLEGAIDARVKEAALINHPSWNLKLIQLFETQRVRHGFMVLGPSGTGKTCCIHVLMKAMTDCNEPHREMRMNPKAITAPQMFGRLDVATNDWTDGIFSTLWRRTHKVKKGEHIWLLLDGPVDTLWIENLNSVLDDNKTLTLANGDRIPMAPDCKIVFEPHNVDNASPATVSRNGMVFMSSSGLDWSPILRSWLLKKSIEKKITQSESDILLSLFEASFLDIFNYVYVILEAKMELLQCNYIVQACIIIEGYLANKEEGVSLSRIHLEHLYIFSLMWSIGALLELNGRVKMEEWIREHKPELDLPECLPDEGDTIFEYYPANDGSWEHWKTRVEEYVYPVDTIPSYNSILVPNVDNVRTDFLIDLVAKQSKPVLLIGEQGTAKTVIIQGYMSRYDIEQHLGKNISFSSATTPGLFQRSIESYIDKRVGSTYGPPAGKKMTVFIDDINMPRINEWGDQITNEIVRQTMEMKGFYSLEKPGDFTHIEDIQFLAAMIHPGGGRNDIPQRLKRQFSVINCTLPSNASIDKIFGAIGCGYFSKGRMFNKDVVDLIPELVVCTRRVWQLTKIKMLPTPAKFHYVFNLRDLSRIWEGMLHIQSDNLSDIKTLLGLWKNECTRVIADRFTSDVDKDWFDRCLVRVLEEELDESIAEKLPTEPYFVDFLREPPEPTGDEPEDFVFEAPKIYEAIPSLPELEERLINYLQQYNETIRGSGMDLVFFKDCMVHLIKISRIIRTDRGNALLVGVGGSGKQSLTRLASFIAGYKIFQIQLSRSYNVNSLLDDLKILYRTAGQQGKGITFIFTDQEIKDEGFLEYINMILSSGEVSNLFARDEIDEICSELIPVMKKQFPRRPPTPDNLYNYFLSRAQENLHVVLCFSPVGEKFRSRSLKFPGLFSGCTMDWFSRWPEDALIAVAQHFLSSYDIVCTPEVKAEVVKAMGVFQDFVAESCVNYFERFRRTTHVTPKSYLSFIAGYKSIYTERKNLLGELSGRMQSGLTKLLEASESVAQLAKELEIKEKDLAIASKEAEQVLAEVTVKAQAAEKVKAEVQTVKDRAQSVADIISADKAVAEEKLEKARPALEEAERALKTITSADIATVRKLGKPPHLIMRIMDCVLLLLQKKLGGMMMDSERPGPKPSWAESLKLMSQAGFLQSLMNFPKDTINEETVELLQPYFVMEDYNLENAKKVCGNVAGLCSWTKAMAAFFAINKEVLPLKANLTIQEAKFANAQTELGNANTVLNEKQSELDKVRAMYDEAMAKKQALIDDAETCKRKMKAASALIEGLGGEKERWTQQSEEFRAQIERLVGDVLLASAFLSYAGPFNQEFRLLLMNAWKKQISKRSIPFSNDLNLADMLTDAATVAEWNLQGLPNDELSVQNGIIVNKASRFPLLIDPQGQGKSWIKNREAGKEFQITTLNNKYFRTHLEDSLSLGKSLLIEDVEEELDPALDNVLEKNFIKAGTMLKVKVGDKEVDVMKGFNLCITTKLPNPSYTPEISARTAIIDFTVTVKGLEDQLLGRVILSEKQELESERVKLMEEVTANKRKMKELEDNLLYRLTSTKGSLVDDESLIEVLRTTKVTAEDVTKKLEIAAQTEVKINAAREEYRPVAARGSVLYFLIVEMSLVNVMYQTSLIQFLSIFDLSMLNSVKSPVTSRRVKNIIHYLTFQAFHYSTRGLYEEHKFLFTLLLALKIDMQRGSVKHSEFQILIKGGAALDLKACPPKCSKWITDMTWLNLVELSKLPQFSEILNQISRNDKAWRVWFDSEAPEETPIPDGYANSLDTFRKLILIRGWCPDRVLPQARKYISESLGKEYAEGVILDMEQMWNESTNRIPMICFLSMGSDPSNNIDTLARKHKLTCQAISMGQGQEVHARRLLQQCQTQGGWLLVQNGHLALDFLDELLLSILETENVHDEFRLWMTTEVHNKFPINLLQTSIKYTFEPPQGVKAGLKRTYTNLTQEQLDVSNLSQWKPMLYAVAFLHTTVQERRKFGPLGWNIPYEFNQGDFNASIQYVQNLLDDMDFKKGISWGAVRYMLGEIQYGGRVTDDFDKRLLNTYAKLYFGDFMFGASFHFYKGFRIPVFKTVKEYCDYIDALSAIISPEVFGMHPNADITYQSNTAKTCLDTILNIQPKDSSGGGGETRESIVKRQAGEMLEKLPDDYLPHEVKARLQKMGSIAPMNIFLRQEIDRMQRVIGLVRSTLQDLQLAIDGTIVMSETLRNTLDNMYDARVPNAWKKVSWESTTIGFWFTELLERDQQFRTWVFGGRPNYFWMTGFFNPQGFLTAMRQEVARAHKGWALDSVVIHNDVTRSTREDITSPPTEGVYIYGLFMDGGGWDKRNSKLVEPQPKVLYVTMPVVHVYAVNTKEHSKDPKLYTCPVYKKPRRTDLTFITSLFLKSNQCPEHWIKRGTALLCDIK